MQRSLQYPVGSVLVLAGVVALLSSESAGPAVGQSADALPRIDKADHKAYTETIPGSQVKFDLVAIPGGTYSMGSPANEAGRSADEGPQHPVTVRPFWMGKLEVSWDEYDTYWKPAI